MRKSLLALAALGFAATALADPVWSRPGWYGVDEVSDGSKLMFAGPFDDEGSCKAVLPDDDIVDKFHCQYFDQQPDFDLDQ